MLLPSINKLYSVVNKQSNNSYFILYSKRTIVIILKKFIDSFKQIRSFSLKTNREKESYGTICWELVWVWRVWWFLLLFPLLKVVYVSLPTTGHWAIGRARGQLRSERSRSIGAVWEPLRQSAGNISTGNICVYIVTVTIVTTITTTNFRDISWSGCYVTDRLTNTTLSIMN